MLVGVDFDNTIVCYDRLFYRIALDRGVIPEELPPLKTAVHHYLHAAGLAGVWAEIQGTAYGPRIVEAEMFPGASDFFLGCRQAGIETCIVSQKTRRPYLGAAFDLHLAAHEWLRSAGFYDDALGLSPERVHFVPTKALKVRLIGQLGCSHFVDDLPEVLSHPAFPRGVRRILFDPQERPVALSDVSRARSWAAVLEQVMPVVAQ